MIEELNQLAAKPERQNIKREAEEASRKAYDRAYKRTAIDAAKAEGAAQGAADAIGGINVPASAVEGARQRALGGAPTPSTPMDTASTPSTPAETVRRVKLPTGETVPEQYYNLPAEDQQRMLELIKERQTKKADDNAALLAVNTLLDLREQDNKRVRALEGQLTTALSFIEVLQQQLTAMTTQIEVAKSDALLEQQAAIGQDIANLSAIRAEAGAEMAAFSRLREEFATENRQALEAQAKVVEALKASVKGTTELMGERSNAIQDELARVEPRVQTLGVQLTELEGRSDAIGNPITRSEMSDGITTAVTGEMKAQLPALLDQELEEMRKRLPNGPFGAVLDRAYVDQTQADRANAVEGRVGTDEAFRRTSSGSRR